MIDLYWNNSPPVLKVHIALEEIGLQYKLIPVNVFKQEQFTPEMTALNPNQKIPVIVDHDGPGGKPYTVFESGAILLYLVDKTGQLAPSDKRKYFDAVQWAIMQVGGLGPMGGQLAHFVRFAAADVKGGYAEARYRTENNRIYDLYDQRLRQSPYLGGDEYSIADISVWPWICYAELHRLDLKRRKHLSAWFEKVKEREAVQRVLATAGDVDKNPTAGATPHDLDRFFGRGEFTRA